MDNDEKSGPGPVWRAIWFAALPFLIALSVAMAVTAYVQRRDAFPMPAEPPPTMAQLLRLSTLPERAATLFVLTDQHGQSTALSQFRGKVVLLLFIDPQCVKTCSDTAQLLADVDRKLGKAATHFAIVGVDVNPNRESLRDIQQITNAQGLDRLANWHAVTGSTTELAPVWSGYGVTPAQSIRSPSSAPSDYWYLVNPFGRLRFIAEPITSGSGNGNSGLSMATIARLGDGIVGYVAKAATG